MVPSALYPSFQGKTTCIIPDSSGTISRTVVGAPPSTPGSSTVVSPGTPSVGRRARTGRPPVPSLLKHKSSPQSAWSFASQPRAAAFSMLPFIPPSNDAGMGPSVVGSTGAGMVAALPAGAACGTGAGTADDPSVTAAEADATTGAPLFG